MFSAVFIRGHKPHIYIANQKSLFVLVFCRQNVTPGVDHQAAAAKALTVPKIAASRVHAVIIAAGRHIFTPDLFPLPCHWPNPSETGISGSI